MAQLATIIPCKFIGASGSGQISDALLCFSYCLQQKSHIISNSYGSIKASAAFEDVINKAVQQGVLVVTSAGNSGLNTDTVPQWPSALSKTNMGVISVAATSQDKTLWVNTNYGTMTVQIAAPGDKIIGVGLNGASTVEVGTSMGKSSFFTIPAIFLLFRMVNLNNCSCSGSCSCRCRGVAVGGPLLPRCGFGNRAQPPTGPEDCNCQWLHTGPLSSRPSQSSWGLSVC